MPLVKGSSPGYQIDGRVSIAMDALNEQQKRAVDRVIADREHFVASTRDGRKVRKISRTRPLYALSVPTGLRIIFSKVGNDIVVMDLMWQAMLDRYGHKRAVKPKRASSTPRPES